MPRCARSSRVRAGPAGTPSRHRSPPCTRTLPACTSSSVIAMRNTVDLPEPEGPISATFSPPPRAKSKPSSTVCSPKRLTTPENSSTGSAADGMAVLQQTDGGRGGETHDEEHDPGDRQRLEIAERAGADQLGGLQHLHHRDRGEE